MEMEHRLARVVTEEECWAELMCREMLEWCSQCRGTGRQGRVGW